MTRYQATLTKAVRLEGNRRKVGEVVEVDESLLEELQKHDAVENVSETKAKSTRSTSKKNAADPETESGE